MRKNKNHRSTMDRTRTNNSSAGSKDGAENSGLSPDEVIRISARSREYALTLTPRAIGAIAQTMHSRDDRSRLSAALALCKISGVLKSSSIEDTMAMAEQNEEQKGYITGGIILQHMLDMPEVFRMPLDPRFVEGVRALNERVEKLVSEVGLEKEIPPLSLPRNKLSQIDEKRCKGSVGPISPSTVQVEPR